MDRTDLLDALRADGNAFAAACVSAGFAAPVESCPGWNVADLVWHLGEVHLFWRTIVDERLSSPDSYREPDRPVDSALLDFYRSGLQRVLDVLSGTDAATPVWTWTADRTVGWVVRRMAQETAVHRWDAEYAAGRAEPIEAELASDGIDEFLAHFTADVAEGAAPVGGTVHLHCTDVAGEWLVVPGSGERGTPPFAVTREHAKGDCAIRGTASDLLLVLWRRQPLDTVDVIGDRAIAERFVAHSALE